MFVSAQCTKIAHCTTRQLCKGARAARKLLAIAVHNPVFASLFTLCTYLPAHYKTEPSNTRYWECMLCMCLISLFHAQVVPHMLTRPVKDFSSKLCINTDKC